MDTLLSKQDAHALLHMCAHSCNCMLARMYNRYALKIKKMSIPFRLYLFQSTKPRKEKLNQPKIYWSLDRSRNVSGLRVYNTHLYTQNDENKIKILYGGSHIIYVLYWTSSSSLFVRLLQMEDGIQIIGLPVQLMRLVYLFTRRIVMHALKIF